jgi:hypothetical protein
MSRYAVHITFTLLAAWMVFIFVLVSNATN